MKKAAIVVIVVLLIVFAGYRIYSTYKGFIRIAKKPSVDIAREIEEKEAEGQVGFPLKLYPGYKISIFASALAGARVLKMDPKGRIFVSLTSQGKIVALEDKDGDGKAEAKEVLSNLNRPHGMEFLCKENTCRFYVAETDGVYVYDYEPETLQTQNPRKIVDLPSLGRHFTRTILIANNKLFISVGSSCDTCFENDWRRSKILVSDLDGSNLKVFAQGLRNSVFMAVHPKTGEIWATEMGRDYLGDNLPPDEINIIKEGKDYGWPLCYGKNVHDTTFDKKAYAADPCLAKEPSYIDIPAHSAPLGLAFTSIGLLVAYHGSWNRSEPTGYKIVLYKLDESGKVIGVTDFVSGWLTDRKEVLGRPVDILPILQNQILVSDDKAGVVYKITGKN
jgi:glucose/arabinose dehydrogenase